MSLLTYRPGRPAPIGADHYVVVLEAGPRTVLLHDPQGHPFATIPAEDFLTAWRADDIAYSPPLSSCAPRSSASATCRSTPR
ncbi:hypothetical protein [Nocardia puris]|uniref:Uncharacterized protein n=1 Tax=Nocardia puris TaxID=208602 RepID=A0A366CYN9_9NOCA|nr:hypothetical protein [Nocardia puris]RBO82937.1 hypothetical protein DFR74_12127 [Nocardia puris]